MKPLLLALSLAASTSAVSGAESGDVEQAPVIAFVGEQLGFEELPDPCADERTESAAQVDTICIAFDELYKADYRVRERLYGVPPGPEISFTVADHYGFPSFARAKASLLFVHVTPDGNYLSKYMGFPVYPTAEGGWAMCGSPYDEDTDITEQRLLPITFADGVVFGDVSTLSPAGVKEQFDPAYFSVVGSKVYCRMGVYVEDLFTWVAQDTMKARDVDLGQAEQAPAEPKPAAKP